MYNFLIILLINLFFAEELTFSVVSETYSNLQPKIIQIYSNTESPRLVRAEYYYESGVLRRIENYKDEQLNDLLVEYNQMGSIQFKGYYEMGRFLGDTLKVFDSLGRISSKHAYVNGSLNGVSYEYRTNGTLIKEEYYINNTLNGHRLTYYNDGNILSKENFKNNLLEGAKYIYHDNGVIYFVGYYTQGLLNGNFLYSNISQEIILSGSAVDNKFHGLLKYYPTNDLILRDNIAKPWEEVKIKGTYSEYCQCYIAEYENGKIKS